MAGCCARVFLFTSFGVYDSDADAAAAFGGDER